LRTDRHHPHPFFRSAAHVHTRSRFFEPSSKFFFFACFPTQPFKPLHSLRAAKHDCLRLHRDSNFFPPSDNLQKVRFSPFFLFRFSIPGPTSLTRLLRRFFLQRQASESSLNPERRGSSPRALFEHQDSSPTRSFVCGLICQHLPPPCVTYGIEGVHVGAFLISSSFDEDSSGGELLLPFSDAVHLSFPCQVLVFLRWAFN